MSDATYRTDRDEVVITQGVEVDFLHGLDVLHHGIVNGPVVVALHKGTVTTWVPVYCTTNSKVLVVNAENITGARTYSVKA